MTIIIVEDEGLTALFLEQSVRSLGHEVLGVFKRSDDLFLFLKENAVDLIFMDINIMGPLDGIQTANTVYLNYPATAFVFLTSYKDTETIKRAQEVRPLGFLIKPIMAADLEAILMVVEGSKQRSVVHPVTEIKMGVYTYNTENKNIYEEGDRILLSSKESVCLEVLVLSRNAYVSAEQLILSIWGYEENRLSSLRELMYRLRKKLPKLDLSSSKNLGYTLSTHNI